MLPIPHDLVPVVSIAIAFAVALVAVWNFLRGMKAVPTPPVDVKVLGAALGDSRALDDIAGAIRDGHVSRGELIDVIKSLIRAFDRLSEAIEDQTREQRRR